MRDIKSLLKNQKETNRNYKLLLDHRSQQLEKSKLDNFSRRVKFVEGANYNVLVENIGPTATYDRISNPLARIGADTENLMNFHTYKAERITQNYNLLTELYRDNWVIQNIISAVPDSITKKWFNVKTSLSKDKLYKLDSIFKRTKLNSRINEGMRWGRLYGGALGIILIKGQTENLQEPLDYDYIMPDSFLGLYIIDRWVGAFPSLEVVDDAEDVDFGLPEYYNVTDPRLNKTLKVHHSKVVRFIGRELPSYERIRELYWGESDVESVYNELVRRDTTAENIASLIFKANLSVLKVKDFDQIFAINNVQAQRRFWELMHNVSVLENSMGIKVIDAESSAEYLNYSFNGIKDIYETIMMDLAGATRIPVTKLFGRSPAGMNATGESDLQNYYDYVDEVRESQFRDIIVKLLPLIALSAWGEIPDDLNFTFDEMKTLDEVQKATIAQQKTATILEAYNTNLIPADIAVKELQELGNKYGIFNNITNEIVDQREGMYAIDIMRDPIADLTSNMFNGDLNNSNPSYENLSYDENNPNREFDPTFGKSGLNHNNIDNLHQDGYSYDEVNNFLLKLKDDIINSSNKKDNYEINLFSKDNESKEVLLNEYDNINKLLKSSNKEYIDLIKQILQYQNEDETPLALLSKFNEVKTTYNNLINYKANLESKIKEKGFELDLMKEKGEFKKELDNILDYQEVIKSLINKHYSIKDSYNDKIDFLSLVDELLNLNIKINNCIKEKENNLNKDESIDKSLIDDIDNLIFSQLKNLNEKLSILKRRIIL